MQTQGFNGAGNGSFVPSCEDCGLPTPLNVQHVCQAASEKLKTAHEELIMDHEDLSDDLEQSLKENRELKAKLAEHEAANQKLATLAAGKPVAINGTVNVQGAEPTDRQRDIIAEIQGLQPEDGEEQ